MLTCLGCVSWFSYCILTLIIEYCLDAHFLGDINSYSSLILNAG